MNTYTAFHVAAMHGFLILFLVLVGLLVLAGLVVLAAWLNHRWSHRDRTKRSEIRDQGVTWTRAGSRRETKTFTRHRRVL